jgi:CBS domain-containing protein
MRHKDSEPCSFERWHALTFTWIVPCSDFREIRRPTAPHQEMTMKTAAEVMNRKFFHASPTDTIGLLVREMGERGLGSVVVLDGKGRPLGVATSAEVESCYDFEELTERLRQPAVCMDEHIALDIAARTLALHPSCCLVLVDAGGAAVGVLSPIELLRGVLKIGGHHGFAPSADREASWEKAELLELDAAHRAPKAPGIILLSPGLDSSAKRVVWAEPTDDMRERLDQMLHNPQFNPRLESILEVYPRTVRFRCLTIYDAGLRERLASALCPLGADAGTRSDEPDQPELASGRSGVMPKVDPRVARESDNVCQSQKLA